VFLGFQISMSNVNEFRDSPYQTLPYQPLQYNQRRPAEVSENTGYIIYDEPKLENNKTHRNTYFTPIQYITPIQYNDK